MSNYKSWIKKQKNRKIYNFSKFSLPILSLREIGTNLFLIEIADNEESNLFKELSGKPIEKIPFIKNIELLLE